MTIYPAEARPRDRGHYTMAPAPWVAGCSDVGIRHHANQDALRVATSSRPAKQAVLAIPDGVSTVFEAEHASLVAVGEARSILVRALVAGGSAEAESSNSVLTRAHEAAPTTGAYEEPAVYTLMAATVADGLIRVGSIGDSRAYWFGDDGMNWQLTKDDSMAQTRMMLGMLHEEAGCSPQTRSIIHQLGHNAADVNPTLVELYPDPPGQIVVCSGGLWNCAGFPKDLAAVFEGAKQVNGNLVELAESLVTWVNSCDGRDNITVMLAYCED